MKKILATKRSEIISLISKNRADTYGTVKNYKKNIKYSIKFYEVLGHLEIILRNKLVENWNQYLIYNSKNQNNNQLWPLDSSNLKKISQMKRINLDSHLLEIKKTKDKLKKMQKNMNQVSNGDIVAGLTFGFWRFCFIKEFDFINEVKLSKIFPYYPFSNNISDDLKIIKNKIDSAHRIRNRIAHHEPIFNDSNLLRKYKDIIELINYISPDYMKIFCEKKLLELEPL